MLGSMVGEGAGENGVPLVAGGCLVSVGAQKRIEEDEGKQKDREKRQARLEEEADRTDIKGKRPKISHRC